MKKLIAKLFLVLLIFSIIDLLAGKILNVLRDHVPNGRYYKVKYSLDQCKEDIIILGSSRGEMNYNPFIIEDSLKMSCWDASSSGQTLPYFRCIQEGILARYAPRVVILNVEADMLEYPLSYEHVGLLRPFYNDHEEIQPIMNRISVSEKYQMMSRFYAYNSSFYHLIRPYLIEVADDYKETKGWEPGEEKMDMAYRIKKLEVIIDNNKLNEEAAAEFETLIKKFEEQGTQVVMVISPNYGKFQSDTPTITYLRHFTKDYNIPLFIYSDDTSIVSNFDYFFNSDHLNRTGSEFFTNKLVASIKARLHSKL